jgi:MFS family permease
MEGHNAIKPPLTYAQLLRGNPPFRRLWLGQVVSELGSWFDAIAVLGLVRQVSGASPEAAAWVLALRFLPFAVAGPLAGTFVDRSARRSVMLAADFARAFVVLGFLFVRGPDDLWLAYLCAFLNSGLGAFFDAGKNGALPNLVGERGLLAGNTLMFSTRFLFLAVGSALGGLVVAAFGYQAAFVVDALSFLVSAWFIRRVPQSAMQAAATGGEAVERPGFWADWREGWRYISKQRLVLTLMGLNILWSFGGGACNLLYERLGGIVLGPKDGWSSDSAVALVSTALGTSLFIGMLLARRVGAWVELKGLTVPFIGLTLILHGVIFALGGWMPTLLGFALMVFLSRLIIGLEFGLQDTLLLRSLPDNLRGRVMTTDRAFETLVTGLSLIVAGRALNRLSPQQVTVIAGLVTALPGVVWLLVCGSSWLKIEKNSPISIR